MIAKQVKCVDIDPEHISNVTCFVKAVRHKHGILTVMYDQKEIEPSVHIKTFIQNSAGRFLPFVIEIRYNYCEWVVLRKSGPVNLIQLIKLLEPFDIQADTPTSRNTTSTNKYECPITVSFSTFFFSL